ncbi:hypothetical protein ACFY00_27010 [Kitasatospora sp. NPDC001540]|uniref:hypothetical protein n=1 Tax=Kitasatospora sp. NPDC001540 TaxID=3364014 RepID=UPI00368B592E
MTAGEEQRGEPASVGTTGFGPVGRPVVTGGAAGGPRGPFGRGEVWRPPGQRLTPDEQRQAGASVALAALLLFLAVLLLLFALPHARAEERAYAAGRSCAAGARECVREVPMTVVSRYAQKSTGRLQLLGPDGGAPHEVQVPADGRLFQQVAVEDRVTGVFWRGALVAVRKDWMRAETSDSPDGAGRPPLLAGTAALLPGLALAGNAVRLRLRARHRA